MLLHYMFQVLEVANGFSKHFQSVYDNFFSWHHAASFLIHNVMIFLTLVFANNDDVCKAIMRMQPLDGIPSFTVKGYSQTFVPLLKFILNLSLFTQTLHAAWKKKTNNYSHL